MQELQIYDLYTSRMNLFILRQIIVILRAILYPSKIHSAITNFDWRLYTFEFGSVTAPPYKVGDEQQGQVAYDFIHGNPKRILPWIRAKP